ncbi:MAG: hypothetical protein V4596_14295 [Bdellovibrionota bacterium]
MFLLKAPNLATALHYLKFKLEFSMDASSKRSIKAWYFSFPRAFSRSIGLVIFADRSCVSVETKKYRESKSQKYFKHYLPLGC